MNFMLPFTPNPSGQKIGYDQKMVCLGSCFAEEIGQLLQVHRFDIINNPHGILFNAISIAHALNDYITNKKYTENDLISHQNLWHSLKHHGSFSDESVANTLNKINSNIEVAHQQLQQAQWLCITLGSSWAYEYLETREVVANCHKIPQTQFKKVLLPIETQVTALQQVITALTKFNPQLRILFTVSPVKYLRDGLIENNLSKAYLLSTVHQLCAANEQCHYFPAYELVTDVLRDYRFYKADMVHPSEQAIQFVWEQFIQTYLNPDDHDLLKEIGDWLKLSAHRPLNQGAAAAHAQKIADSLQHINQKLEKYKTSKPNGIAH